MKFAYSYVRLSALFYQIAEKQSFDSLLRSVPINNFAASRYKVRILK